jgi:hypothetical protein
MKAFFSSKKGIALIILVVIFVFYWFEARPSIIKSKCAEENSYSNGALMEGTYEGCLRRNGL